MLGFFPLSFKPISANTANVTTTTVSSVVLTSGTTWTVPPGVAAGSVITVETWGAGSGGNGRVASTFGAGGGGGGYAKSNYVVTPNDISAGITYAIGTGSAGTSGANSTAGGDTTFAVYTNLLHDNTNQNVALGTTAFPSNNWSFNFGANPNNGILATIVGYGIDGSTNLPYIDINFSGTTTVSDITTLYFDTSVTTTAGLNYVQSGYAAIVGGTSTNITGFYFTWIANNGGSYLSTQSTAFTPTTTLTRFTNSASMAATANNANLSFQFAFNIGNAINCTMRLAGVQFEQAASATFVKTTPGYTLAKGAAAATGTTGATGGQAASSIGTLLTYNGGNGANYSASGAGGGGAAGALGAGANGTTAGGTGDNGSGGAGGAAGTTAHAGTANALGGGGGGGLTAAGTAGAGGLPGGGGGGADIATGTGGAGANGQIKITYSQVLTPTIGTAFGSNAVSSAVIFDKINIVGTASGSNATTSAVIFDQAISIGTASGSNAVSSAVIFDKINSVGTSSGAGNASGVVAGETAIIGTSSGAGDAIGVSAIAGTSIVGTITGTSDASAETIAQISVQGYVFDSFGDAIGAGNYIYAPIVIHARPLITWMS